MVFVTVSGILLWFRKFHYSVFYPDIDPWQHGDRRPKVQCILSLRVGRRSRLRQDVIWHVSGALLQESMFLWKGRQVETKRNQKDIGRINDRRWEPEINFEPGHMRAHQIGFSLGGNVKTSLSRQLCVGKPQVRGVSCHLYGLYHWIVT